MQKIKDVVIFILFLIYVVSIFFIRNYFVLLTMVCFNTIIMGLIKINFISAIRNLFGLGIFILITVVINILTVDLNEGILVGARFMIACNTTYIFSKLISPFRLAKVIELIIMPMKIIGINPRNIGIIICIAISFIPILKREILQILDALKSKGYELRIRNCNIIFKPLLISILKRTNEIEASLISKAYQGE